MTNPHPGDDRERRLSEAAAHLLELEAAGKSIDRQYWLAHYPDLSNELDEFLSDLDDFMHRNLKQTFTSANVIHGEGTSPSRQDFNTIGPYVELA